MESYFRWSSTHRVAVESKDTMEYIFDKANTAIKTGISDVFKQQEALNEIEFEWIRQYWVQASRLFTKYKLYFDVDIIL